MKRKVMAIGGAAVAVALLSLSAVLFHPSGGREAVESGPEEGGRGIAEREVVAPPSAAEPAAEAEHEVVPAAPRAALPSPPGDPLEFRRWMKSLDWAEFEAWAADSLRMQFGRTIANRGNQASLMELRQFLRENFPEDADAKLSALLHRAFPDVADQILDTMSGMDRYNEWFEANRLDLAAMQDEEIKAAIWDARREFFGEDATEIWAPESSSEHVRDVMKILEEAYDIPLEDRLQLFKSAIEEEPYQEGADPLMKDKSHVMALAFLNMESVQDELGRMNPDERAETLRHIRRSMGIDEEDIEEMERLDAERERRWQHGLRYMEEREVLTSDYEGAALEEELRFLRERYFGDEARTIEAEEASGFFRYERRRVYGRN